MVAQTPASTSWPCSGSATDIVSPGGLFVQDTADDEPSPLHQHLPDLRPKAKGVTLPVRDSCGEVRAVTVRCPRA